MTIFKKLNNLCTFFDSTNFPPQGNAEYEIEAPFIMKNYKLAIVSFSLYTYTLDLSKSNVAVVYAEDSSYPLNQNRTGLAKYIFDIESNKIKKTDQKGQGYTGITAITLFQ